LFDVEAQKILAQFLFLQLPSSVVLVNMLFLPNGGLATHNRIGYHRQQLGISTEINVSPSISYVMQEHIHQAHSACIRYDLVTVECFVL
jgi:hypothetical protein